ncbi:hypothetical protein WA026_010865 [Henosepilachna vigintioctopunctata]|uniref:Protein quiver n=1 Tax=Henosepilachna vigintioctopunctata TaxID=420089 RepID=A0AAW1URC3_9CUCU
MAKLICAFVIVALMAVTANALKCYECPLGCQGTDKSKWPTQDCGATAANSKKVCLRQVVTIPGSPDRVTRKCAIIPDGKSKYECVDAPHEKTTSCDTCSDDLCNSAGSVTFSFLAFASVIIPILASKFFVH